MIQIYENYFKLLNEYNKLFKYFKDNASWREDIDVENIETADELINVYSKEVEEAYVAEQEYVKISLDKIKRDEMIEAEKNKFCKCVICDYCKNDIPF